MVARGIGTFNAKKIGIIYTSDDAGKDMLTGAKEKCEELGIEYVSEQVAAGAADVSAAVTSIKNANVDFVIVGAIQATMPTIVKEMASQALSLQFWQLRHFIRNGQMQNMPIMHMHRLGGLQQHSSVMD